MMRKILYVLIVINIVLLLLLSSFNHAAFNFSFYSDQYIKNEVYDRFGKEKVNNLTHEMFDFLKDKGELDRTFYNQKELEHMQDVQSIFKTVRTINIIVLISFIVLLYLYFKKGRLDFKELSRIFITSALVIISVVIICLLLSSQFSTIFYLFHKIAFTNDKWLLNPQTDNLIVLFPSTFFSEMTKQIVIYWFFNGLIFLGIGLINYFYDKKIFKKIQ